MSRAFGIILFLLITHLGYGQVVVGLPKLQQVDSTSFDLTLRTDSEAVITVHVAEDTTYKSAFIFLGRTVSDLNDASIRIDGLRNHTDYYYRIFLGTEMSSISGTFNTGDPPKK